MTRTEPNRSRSSNSNSGNGGGGRTTGMRIIVPLQGVVQGRGGLFLGSVIPCAFFYFLQFYLKRNRKNDASDNSGEQTSSASASSSSSPNSGLPDPTRSQSAGHLTELTGLPRSLSRILLSPRSSGGAVSVSGRVNCVIKGGDSSPYYVGQKRVDEDPYDELGNPDGVIQLGLAQNNKVCNQISSKKRCELVL